MAKETDDGAVIESALPVTNKADEYIRFNNKTLYRAQVEEVLYVDDERNKSKQCVEYNLTLTSYKANDGYRRIYNARSINSLGGLNDFSEIIYQPKTQELTRGKEGGKAYPENTNGDFVMVMFLEGNEQSCVILGSWYHPRTNIPESKTKRAKKEDGHRVKFEYNGVVVEINKDGELIMQSLGGPRDINGNLTNSGNGGILIKLGKDGKITLDTQSQPKVTIDKNSNEVVVESGSVKIGSGAIEPMVLGISWMTYNNTVIVPTINALIAAVGGLASSADTHTHAYTWTGTSGSGATSPPGSSTGVTPPASAAAATPTILAKKGKVE